MTSNAAVTPHYLSAAAAREVMSAEGNAVDGAIAAVAAQGVVAPETCGIGGDLFALVLVPGEDRPRALNASGRAGSNADPETLRARGHDQVPPDHPLTVTIPGCIEGLSTLAESLGNRSLAECLDPAIHLAESGFPVSTEQSRAFTAKAANYRDNPAVVGFYPEGKAVAVGDRVARPDLAATLRAVAEEGRDAFYRGRPGEDIVEAVDGLITMEDLEADHTEWVEPIGARVADMVAWTLPPNSQGYLGPGTLAVFESLDPPGDPLSPLWWHLLIESYRCLAWERNDLVAEPATLPLPEGLFLDPGRLARAATTVSRERCGVWPERVGSPAGTAYLCVADAEGMAVSIIQSNYRGTGSPFGARRSGFLLQDRGGGFSLVHGHPNELGPGKRPLHTLSPTLWTAGSEARWLIGTRGGAVQPQLVAQVGAALAIAGTSPEMAQEIPRWTVPDFGPGAEAAIRVEPGLPVTLLRDLTAMGHRIGETETRQSGWGPVSIIGIDGSERVAAADPRVDTTAALVF